MSSCPRTVLRALSALVACGLFALACTPSAATPTPAPAKPNEAPNPAAPAGQPAVAPAAAGASPAKPGASDEQAVADFYRGKIVRILVGAGPGGLYDVAARSISRYLGKYILGNPTVIVENKTGAGGLIAYNSVYNNEPKDGTVILTAPPLILLAVLGADGISFDPSKIIWLGSVDRSFTTCLVRNDLGVNTIQDLIGGKQVALGSLGPGNSTNDVPLVLNAALGTNFKLVSGYDTLAKVRLVIQSKEVDGYCPVFSGASTLDRPILEGDNPFARIITYTSNKPEEHPLLRGALQAESLAKTEQARLLIRAADAQNRMTLSYSLAPAVPPDRVASLRKALAAILADPEFRADAEQAKLPINPNTAEEVEQVVQELVRLPAEVTAKLKEVLK